MTDCTNIKNKIQESYGSTACGVCTNNGLSLKSNHNSHINKQFNFLDIRPNDLVNRPSDLVNRPSDLVNRPNDLVNRPNDLFIRPSNIIIRFTLVNKCYFEKLGKQLKDLLKCITNIDTFLSNYETITVVGK